MTLPPMPPVPAVSYGGMLVLLDDYNELRTAASAYLEALRVAMQEIEYLRDNRRAGSAITLDDMNRWRALTAIGEVPKETI